MNGEAIHGATCANCGGPMGGRRITAATRFCSDACKDKADNQQRRVASTCGSCGAPSYKGTHRCKVCYCSEAAAAKHAQRFWKPDKVIEELRRVALALGNTPATSDVRPTLVKVAQREFGSWSAAVGATGLPPRERQTATPHSKASIRSANRQMVTGGRMGASQRTNRLGGKPTW